MVRNASAVLALICLTALPAVAGESHDSGIGFSRSDLLKSSFDAGRVGLEVFAADRVDVAALMADVDLSRTVSAQAIADVVMYFFN